PIPIPTAGPTPTPSDEARLSSPLHPTPTLLCLASISHEEPADSQPTQPCLRAHPPVIPALWAGPWAHPTPTVPHPPPEARRRRSTNTKKTLSPPPLLGVDLWKAGPILIDLKKTLAKMQVLDCVEVMNPTEIVHCPPSALLDNYQALSPMRETGDVILVGSDGGCIRAHSVLLGALSPILHSYLSAADLCPHGEATLIFPDLKLKVLSTFIDVLYTGKTVLRACDVAEVEEAAAWLCLTGDWTNLVSRMEPVLTHSVAFGAKMKKAGGHLLEIVVNGRRQFAPLESKKTSVPKKSISKATCKHCGKRFPSRVSLEKHINSCENAAHAGSEASSSSKEISCGVCWKVFRKPSDLVRHLPMHLDLIRTKQGTTKCDVCQEIFSKKSELVDHMTTVHLTEFDPENDDIDIDLGDVEPSSTPSSIKEYPCGICETKCPNVTALIAHVKTHDKEPDSDGEELRSDQDQPRAPRWKWEYACPSCDATFDTGPDLQQHSKDIHNDEILDTMLEDCSQVVDDAGDDDESDEQEQQTGEPPKKRGPGRPRKNASTPTPSTSTTKAVKRKIEPVGTSSFVRFMASLWPPSATLPVGHWVMQHPASQVPSTSFVPPQLPLPSQPQSVTPKKKEKRDKEPDSDGEELRSDQDHPRAPRWKWEYACPSCDATFDTGPDLQQHSKDIHNDEILDTMLEDCSQVVDDAGDDDESDEQEQQTGEPPKKRGPGRPRKNASTPTPSTSTTKAVKRKIEPVGTSSFGRVRFKKVKLNPNGLSVSPFYGVPLAPIRHSSRWTLGDATPRLPSSLHQLRPPATPPPVAASERHPQEKGEAVRFMASLWPPSATLPVGHWVMQHPASQVPSTSFVPPQLPLPPQPQSATPKKKEKRDASTSTSIDSPWSSPHSLGPPGSLHQLSHLPPTSRHSPSPAHHHLAHQHHFLFSQPQHGGAHHVQQHQAVPQQQQQSQQQAKGGGGSGNGGSQSSNPSPGAGNPMAPTPTAATPFSCPICNRSFSKEERLRAHQRTAHEGPSSDLPFRCPTCLKGYRKEEKLRNHFLICQEISGGRAFVCDVCSKGFAKQDKLARHRKIHSGLKPYACPTCFKTFSRSDKVKRHVRTHTGEKPYNCEICHKQFSRSDKLAEHKRQGRCKADTSGGGGAGRRSEGGRQNSPPPMAHHHPGNAGHGSRPHSSDHFADSPSPVGLYLGGGVQHPIPNMLCKSSGLPPIPP
ncbi:unnamed protein product, partial [Cyprideis torosa]